MGSVGQTADEVRPLSRRLYLDYARWFQEQKGIEPRPQRITVLRQEGSRFIAEAGDVVYDAATVVLAIGFENFKNLPAGLCSLLPPGSYSHTCDVVDFERFAGKDVLIVGGRQSAFESAALIAEAGARNVHLSYRHGTPRFERSDWSFVDPLMQRFLEEPSWFRRLDEDERAALNRRFWEAGRLRLEPWLGPRIARDNVRLHPNSSIASCEENEGVLQIRLDSGDGFTVDDVLLATGYRVDVDKVPFLDPALLELVEKADGFPELDEHFESSAPGLYFTSMMATRDFGSFFAFTVSARVAARLIGDAVRERLRS